MTLPNGRGHIDFPANLVQSPTTFNYTELATPGQDVAGFEVVGHAFTLEARDANGASVTTFPLDYTITLNYSSSDLLVAGVTDETTLNLYYWSDTAAVWLGTLPCTGCSVDTTAHVLTASLDHLTTFAQMSSRGSLSSGVNYSGTLTNRHDSKGNLITQKDTWTFQSDAGKVVWLSVSEVGANTPFNPWLTVYGPDGKLEGGNESTLRAEVTFSAPLSGTYTAVVARYDSVDGTAQYLVTIAQPSLPFVDEDGQANITNGGNYTGSILRGDLDQWSFQAEAGKAVWVTVSEVGQATAFNP
jgi:hypothetical protein